MWCSRTWGVVARKLMSLKSWLIFANQKWCRNHPSDTIISTVKPKHAPCSKKTGKSISRVPSKLVHSMVMSSLTSFVGKRHLPVKISMRPSGRGRGSILMGKSCLKVRSLTAVAIKRSAEQILRRMLVLTIPKRRKKSLSLQSKIHNPQSQK